MKLEDQVVSLELAKKLKELGVKQESIFGWRERRYNKTEPKVSLLDSYDDGMFNVEGWEFVAPAFTVAELGEMLPAVLKLGDTGKLCDYCCIEFQKYSTGENRWGVLYTEDEETVANYNGQQVEQYAHTEADARAKMLIYLIENNLIQTK